MSISLRDLEPNEIADILGIPSNASRMKGLIGVAMSELLSEDNTTVSFDDLYKKIEEWSQGNNIPNGYKTTDATNVLRILKMAKAKGLAKLFSSATTPLDKIVKKKHISVIDLSGLKSEIQDIITRIFLARIYEANTTGKEINPVFLVIEEAHNFIPYKKSTKSSGIIKKIAAEGRKFGVFLVIITQRPQKVDPDVLSQANSYIILRLTNREDIRAVTTAAESLSEDLSSLLPTLNPGEAVIVGPIIKVPAIVKIKERKTKEGGGDIDLISKLEEANELTDEDIERSVKEIKDLMGE